jgi:hypothetical protein
MQSLHSFCSQYDVPKTSVKRWLNDQGFDTSQGMTEEAIAAAMAHFRIAPATPTAPTATGGITSTTEIITGNHRGQLALPSQPSSLDLSTYRGDAALTSFEPEDITRFLESCDVFVQAVDADYKHQQAITQQKAAAAQQVKAKVEQVQQASLIYQLRSESLALHNAALDQALQRDMAVLGKPAAPPATDA